MFFCHGNKQVSELFLEAAMIDFVLTDVQWEFVHSRELGPSAQLSSAGSIPVGICFYCTKCQKLNSPGEFSLVFGGVSLTCSGCGTDEQVSRSELESFGLSS